MFYSILDCGIARQFWSSPKSCLAFLVLLVGSAMGGGDSPAESFTEESVLGHPCASHAMWLSACQAGQHWLSLWSESGHFRGHWPGYCSSQQSGSGTPAAGQTGRLILILVFWHTILWWPHLFISALFWWYSIFIFEANTLLDLLTPAVEMDTGQSVIVREWELNVLQMSFI